MEEVRVARDALDETVKRLTREGNAVQGFGTDPDTGELVIRYERRTEIRDGI